MRVAGERNQAAAVSGVDGPLAQFGTARGRNVPPLDPWKHVAFALSARRQWRAVGQG
jgi:hypothetical protein